MDWLDALKSFQLAVIIWQLWLLKRAVQSNGQRLARVEGDLYPESQPHLPARVFTLESHPALATKRHRP